MIIYREGNIVVGIFMIVPNFIFMNYFGYECYRGGSFLKHLSMDRGKFIVIITGFTYIG